MLTGLSQWGREQVSFIEPQGSSWKIGTLGRGRGAGNAGQEGALVSYSQVCWPPQQVASNLQGVKATGISSRPFGVRSLKSRLVSPGASRVSLFPASLPSCWCWLQTLGALWLEDASLQPLPLSPQGALSRVCVCVCMCFPTAFLSPTCLWIWGLSWSSVTSSLKKNSFTSSPKEIFFTALRERGEEREREREKHRCERETSTA